nr:hypothetical protein [Staphylococcus warneri]
MHIWSVSDDKGANDELYMQVQNILLNDISLDGYTLTQPNLAVNEMTVIETNQELLHTVINIEYNAH